MGIRNNHFLTCDLHASADCPYIFNAGLEESITEIVGNATLKGWVLIDGKWYCPVCKPEVISQFKVHHDDLGWLLIWVLSDDTVQVSYRPEDWGTWGRPFYGNRIEDA